MLEYLGDAPPGVILLLMLASYTLGVGTRDLVLSAWSWVVMVYARIYDRS